MLAMPTIHQILKLMPAMEIKDLFLEIKETENKLMQILIKNQKKICKELKYKHQTTHKLYYMIITQEENEIF